MAKTCAAVTAGRARDTPDVRDAAVAIGATRATDADIVALAAPYG